MWEGATQLETSVLPRQPVESLPDTKTFMAAQGTGVIGKGGESPGSTWGSFSQSLNKHWECKRDAQERSWEDDIRADKTRLELCGLATFGKFPILVLIDGTGKERAQCLKGLL